MSQTYSSPAPATSRMQFLLTAVWGILTLVALAYVYACGFNAPVIDEWEFVGVLTGNEPWTPWLWAQHNEHRLPLPKLIYYTQFWLTHDFRSGMYIVVAMQSALSLGLMRYSARLRGRSDWVDAFFPISLLHIGQWENFLLGYQICFALFTVLVSLLIVVALNTTKENIHRSGIQAILLVMLIALTGGAGLVLVVPVVLWVAYLAAIQWRSGEKRKASVLFGLCVVPIVYLAIYFASYSRPADVPPSSHDPIAILAVAGQVLAMSLGIGVSGVWWLVAIVMVAIGIATTARLIHEAKNPTERPGSVGLIAIAAGLFGIALVIGYSRASFGPDMGLWSRYGSLSWPLLGAAFLVWVKAGKGVEPRELSKWLPIVLCVASALAFPPNMGTGMMVGISTVQRYTGMEQDLRNGISDQELIRKHFSDSRDAGQEDRAIWGIPMLREARISIFTPIERRESQTRLWRVVIFVIVLGVAFAARWLLHLGKAVQVERARELFRLQHERFEEQLLKAAGATGLPRGLRWVSCLITGNAVLVRDAQSKGIVALVPVTVQFEPVEGSDMMDVPAAREPRPATAVFTFARGTWETTGKVVFNHTPEQVVKSYEPQFRPIQHGHH